MSEYVGVSWPDCFAAIGKNWDNQRSTHSESGIKEQAPLRATSVKSFYGRRGDVLHGHSYHVGHAVQCTYSS